MPTRTRKGFISALLAVVIVTLATPSAQADYFGANYADSSHHTFWYSQTTLGSTRYTAAEEARTYSLANNTDMTTALVPTNQYLPTTDVTVIMQNGALHPTWYAWTECKPGYDLGSVCDAFIVSLSTTVGHSNYRSLMCHEFGHTIGLKDGQNATYGPNSSSSNSTDRSCMRSSPDWNYYSNHDRGHINARY